MCRSWVCTLVRFAWCDVYSVSALVFALLFVRPPRPLTTVEDIAAVFAALKEHILSLAQNLYCHYDEVLTYRGVDYATALQSSKPLAAVDHQLPLMRNLAHLLRG